MLVLCALGALLGCTQAGAPFARLAGVVLDSELHEISGIAASHQHADTLWMLNDGGNPPNLYATTRYGRRLAKYRVTNVANTDWEDLAAFDLDGKHYLLIADTGDNGGLRKTLQLHAVREPGALSGGELRPAWSIVFRWPDGPRDCEAVAVDVRHKQILLISKKRQPPEVFMLPLRPVSGETPQIARRIGRLTGVPQADPQLQANDPQRARLYAQVTAADISPDNTRLAVLTYSHILIYRRHQDQNWTQALEQPPQQYEAPLIPQAEALAWTMGGGGLYATGEFSPAPIFFLRPTNAG